NPRHVDDAEVRRRQAERGVEERQVLVDGRAAEGIDDHDRATAPVEAVLEERLDAVRGPDLIRAVTPARRVRLRPRLPTEDDEARLCRSVTDELVLRMSSDCWRLGTVKRTLLCMGATSDSCNRDDGTG